MPVNKSAMTRYLALDKCFNNFGRKYFFKDLKDACNEALSEFGESVSDRQIFNDMKFMQSEQGWAIPLEKQRFGNKVYYRYKTNAFSIRNQGLTTAEIDQVGDTLAILGRFKGIPNMDWIYDFSSKLSTITGNTIDLSQKTVDFQENPFLKGLNHFKDIFNSIKNQKVLELEYKSFRQETSIKYFFHPYYLKEYNNRWFVMGKSEGFDEFSIFALDRICKITETDSVSEKTNYDFSEHFDDIIGVTWNKDQNTEIILLKVHKSAWPYIETKPIHGSQKRWRDGDDEHFTGIQLEVQINYELIANILYRGSAIKVIEPKNLIGKLSEEVKKMSEYYKV